MREATPASNVERAASYFIHVPLNNQPNFVAQYPLSFQEKHAATDADRERFALQMLDEEVVALFRQQEKFALQQAAAKGRAAATRWLALHEPERAGRMFNLVGRCFYLLNQKEPLPITNHGGFRRWLSQCEKARKWMG